MSETHRHYRLFEDSVTSFPIHAQTFFHSLISAIRVGLLLAPGGEFAFVAFGEAVNQVFVLENCFAFLEFSGL